MRKVDNKLKVRDLLIYSGFIFTSDDLFRLILSAVLSRPLLENNMRRILYHHITITLRRFFSESIEITLSISMTLIFLLWSPSLRFGLYFALLLFVGIYQLIIDI